MIAWCRRKKTKMVFNTTQGEHVHDSVEKGVVKLQYIATDEQVADILTKSLSKVKFG